MPTVQEAAYAAGIFDGEGTIDIKDRVRMAVKMTDREPVIAMQDILGGHFYQWKDTKMGRPVYEWRASGWEGTVEAIDTIIEFSLGKRRQLEVVQNYYFYKERFGNYPDARQAASFQLRSLRLPECNPITFDIETMGFEADTLPMLSCSFLEGNYEDRTYSAVKLTPASDMDLVLQTREILEAAPYTIGWNSSRFDINFVNTRLSKWGQRPMFLGCHIDASIVFDRFFGNKKRTSLVNAANQMEVTDEKVHKTPIDWVIWNAANVGDEEAMKYVADHSEKDIILTKRVYDAVTR